ncbi:MAG: hypothetical protein RL169_245, partial [Armatimonadota bacterium]
MENKAPVSTWLAVFTAAITAAVASAAAGVQQAKPPVNQPSTASFRVNVHPLLTRYGCSQGACHGSAAGRGGLRLSLLGGNPESDYNTLVYSANGRLVAGTTPDESLLLQKASGQLNHGGGERIARGSGAYATLKAWLETAMPAPLDLDAIRDIHITTTASVLQSGKTAIVNVHATTASGARIAVSHNAIFDSLDDGTATVSASGTVTAIRPGIARIMVRFGGHTKAIAFTVPLNASPRPLPLPSKTGIIDAEVGQIHQALRAVPGKRATEATLLRRL